MKFNVDSFTPVYMALTPSKPESQDEIEVRELSKFVQTAGIESLVTIFNQSITFRLLKS